MTKIKHILDIASSIAILAIVALFAYRVYSPQQPMAPQPPAASQFLKQGDQIAKLAPHLTKDKNLVAVMSSHCGYCAKSLPLLADLHRLSGQDLIAVFPRGDSEADRFLQNGGMVPKIVTDVFNDDMHIRGTPTWAIFDRKGKALKVWVGMLTEPTEKEILGSL